MFVLILYYNKVNKYVSMLIINLQLLTKLLQLPTLQKLNYFQQLYYIMLLIIHITIYVDYYA
jgi:hypothetical protein